MRNSIQLPLIFATALLALGVQAAGVPLAVAPASAALLPQDGGDEVVVEDKREVVKELIGTFEDHTKKKGEEDVEAIKVMDQLLAEFTESGPKDRASIVKALEKALLLPRKDSDEGVKEARLATAAAVCLGEMAPESVKPLIAATSGKKLRDNLDLLRRTTIALGKTKDGRAVKPLLSLMSDKMPIVQGAGIEALGEFRELDQKVRKDIVEELLKLIMPIKSTVDTDPSDTITREQYDVIGPPTITTLQRLTDQDMRDLVEWQQWWNNNKRADWDSEDN